MGAIDNLKNIDVWSVFYGLMVFILFGQMIYKTIVEGILQKFEIETKAMRQKREDHELLVATANGLQDLYEDKEEALKKIHNDNTIWKEHSIKVQEIYDDRFKKLDEVKERTEEFIKNEKEKKQQINSLTLALKELLAAKINEKYKYYISIEGIPEDEVDEFTSLHFAYKGCGGNHHGDAKYNYVINNLPVIPVKTKLVYDKENN